MRAAALALSMCGATMLGAAAALAQSGLQFEPSGRLSLGATDRTPGADLFLYGDTSTRLSFGGPLGFELGTYGYVNALDSPHETYGAFTWDFDFGRLSVGVPRPAYDGFAVSALERGFPALGADMAGVTRSEATTGAMFAGYLPYGLRFDAAAGPFTYAFSVHEASNVGVTVASAGLTYSVGDWTLSGAVEGNWGGPADLSAKAQAAWTRGALGAGLGLYAPGPLGTAEVVEGFASYRALPELTVTGVVQAPLDGTDPTLALSGRYDLTDRFGLSVGAASVAGSDAVFNAFVDFNF